jgi:hypothetical protein
MKGQICEGVHNADCNHTRNTDIRKGPQLTLEEKFLRRDVKKFKIGSVTYNADRLNNDGFLLAYTSDKSGKVAGSRQCPRPRLLVQLAVGLAVRCASHLDGATIGCTMS